MYASRRHKYIGRAFFFATKEAGLLLRWLNYLGCNNYNWPKITDSEKAIGFFINARNKNIEFIQSTQEDLRDRYWQHPATGVIDLYHAVLLISAHCERHTAQIKEIKTSDGYPIVSKKNTSALF